jgi:hypothetical protein
MSKCLEVRGSIKMRNLTLKISRTARRKRMTQSLRKKATLIRLKQGQVMKTQKVIGYIPSRRLSHSLDTS